MSVQIPKHTFTLTPYSPTLRERVGDSKLLKPGMIFLAIVGASMTGIGYVYDLPALMGGGIAILGAEALVSLALFATRKQKDASFTVSTHNVGYNGFCGNKDWYRGKITRRQDATGPRQERFQKDSHASIICMQETGTTFNPVSLRKALPHYDFLQAPHREDKDSMLKPDPTQADTVVGWDCRRFVKIGEGVIEFDAPKGQLDTQMVLLYDKVSGKRILVASAHVDGFNIADFKKDKTLPSVRVGDDQLIGIRNVLSKISADYGADVEIIGMDANTDRGTHATRLKILEDEGYVTDEELFPTCLDAITHVTLKLDHIAIKTTGKKATLKGMSSDERSHWANADSYCDHTKVTTQVTFS